MTEDNFPAEEVEHGWGASEQSLLAIRIAIEVIPSFQWTGLGWAG